MMTQGHLSKEMIEKLKSGRLSKEEKLAALDHIGECDFCANAFSSSFEQEGLMFTAPDFSSEIMKKIGKPQGKREFYLYSFKVGIAACIALLLLFSGGLRYGADGHELKKTALVDLSRVNSITEHLRGISDRFVDLDESGQLIGGI